MILQHHNLTWDVASPSHWRLVLPFENGDTIDVSFLGDQWCLFVGNAGDVQTRMFPSRDHAVAMVAKAFRKEGMTC